MFGLIKKMFIVSSSILNASNHTKCVLLSNQKLYPTLLVYILINTVVIF